MWNLCNRNQPWKAIIYRFRDVKVKLIERPSLLTFSTSPSREVNVIRGAFLNMKGTVELNHTEYPPKIPVSTAQQMPEPGKEALNVPHPIFMTHGLLGSKQNWNAIAKAVNKATGRMVITIDARNHGDSPHVDEHNYEVMGRDIIRLADSRSIEQFCMLGHSMGGRSVMSAALTIRPERIEKLIVVDVSPMSMSGTFGEMKSYLETLMAIQPDPKLTMSEARRWADQQLQAVTEEASLRAFLLTNLAKSDERGFYWKPNLHVLLTHLHELRIFPENLDRPKFARPTLFICGGCSTYVPVSDQAGIKNIFPKAQFVYIKGSGHWPQADNPNEFIARLLEFLDDKYKDV